VRGLGTLVNVATVVAGTVVGILVGRRVPERVRDTVLWGIGLITIGVGVASFLQTGNTGFVIASLTFCVGALTVVGSLQDGISGDAQLLIVKAALDGIVSVVFAAVYGWGVAFSALSVLVLQGLVTGLGVVVGDNLLDDRMVAEMEATGGPMIIGVGLRLLDLKQIRLASFLPGLAVAPILVALFAV
jgi:uncharacterized membrane protein YqgA involved in biofilm formation